jgi:hypothetical protein
MRSAQAGFFCPLGVGVRKTPFCLKKPEKRNVEALEQEQTETKYDQSGLSHP